MIGKVISFLNKVDAGLKARLGSVIGEEEKYATAGGWAKLWFQNEQDQVVIGGVASQLAAPIENRKIAERKFAAIDAVV